MTATPLSAPVCEDPALLDLWHPMGALENLAAAPVVQDRLLGVPVTIRSGAGGEFVVTRDDELAGSVPLPTLQRYGYLWISLGSPRPLFGLPEADEPDRRLLHAASVTVHTSAGRSIENFLDMAHFPFVHNGTLGEGSHTEVKDYNVSASLDEQEILATDCLFFQPQAALGSSGGVEVNYTYRVPHPHCSILYKSSPGQPERLDAIGLFVQARDEEHICAHMLLCLLDDEQPDWALRRFQIGIFGQDKPILENQLPRRLPLDPRAETPIRADKTAVAYRRWLRQMGVRYGVLAEVQ